MENLLLKKLQIKPGFKVRVLNAPENCLAIFEEIPKDIQFSFNEDKDFNALLIFCINKADMIAALRLTAHAINEQMICWIIYPKVKSKLASDLNLMQSWTDLNDFNLSPCASAAIDETWTAIRIKPAGSVKKSGISNEDLQNSPYGDYIDVKNKRVTLPDDLKSLLEKDSTALNFYQQLSYSNQKEYVLWVLTAKQDKTRQDRILKTLAKLVEGKKNPSEK